MKLGIFDFGNRDSDASQDREAAIQTDGRAGSGGDGGLELELDAEMWDALDDDFGTLTLEDLEEALGGVFGGVEAPPAHASGRVTSVEREIDDALEGLLDGDKDDLDLDGPSLEGLSGGSLADLVGEEVSDTGADAPAAGDELSTVETAQNAVSGMVSDEVVLALLHDGVLRVADVFNALRNRVEGMPLWRAVLAIEGADPAAVLAEVARCRQYPVIEVPEGAPVAALLSNMREQLSDEAVEALLALGALPVERGIDEQSMEYTLKIAAIDPIHPDLLTIVADLPLKATIGYAPIEQISALQAQHDLPAPSLNALVVVDESDPSHQEGEAAPRREIPSGRHQLPGRGGDRGALSRAESSERRVQRLEWPDKNDEQAEAEEPEQTPETAPEATTEQPPISAEEAEVNLERIDRRARKDRVVAALVRSGTVSPDIVNDAASKHAADGSREAIWRVLAGLDGVDREKVFSEAARVYAFPEVELGPGQPDHEFVLLIMETIAEERRDELLKLHLLPFEYAIDAETGGARLIFITHDPARSDVHRILAQLKLGRFELRYASEKGISKVISEVFPKRNEFLERIDDSQAYDLGADFEQDTELVDETALEAEMSRSGLINLFEATLVEAVRQGVSDIHIFPNPKRQVEIHFRVDGRLKKWHTEEKVHAESFLAVVKDNSMNVDRFERDAAQDGYIQRKVDDSLIRFRVSVLPIASANSEIRAESIVIRVLDDRKVLTDLSKLGMLEGAMERMDHAIRQPHGMVILTGPTGSGKSTTLVAALHQVITPEVNVLTIEDPVEYIIKGVRQIKLSHKLDLEKAIRAVLRHDPDIVMVGEMRDKPTADLAIKLANTGHLTFSTLHTNDAPAAVSRLYKMGVEPFLIAYAINLVVAQRLIRTLCPNCKVEVSKRDPVLMKRLGFTDHEIEHQAVYEAPTGENSCATCGGRGYKGRRAVSETLYFSQAIRHIIAESGEEIDEDQIRTQAVKEGMLTLQDSARELVKMGETSIDEMLRVTASE